MISDPVTRNPFFQPVHRLHQKQCEGGDGQVGKVNGDLAIPYSSIYHPIAFTAFSNPGSYSGSPFASVMILPFTGSLPV